MSNKTSRKKRNAEKSKNKNPPATKTTEIKKKGVEEEVDVEPVEPRYSDSEGTTLKHRVKHIFSNSLAQKELKKSLLSRGLNNLNYHDAYLRNHIFDEVVHGAQSSSIGMLLSHEIATSYRYDGSWDLMELSYSTFPLWVEWIKTEFETKFGSSDPLFKPEKEWTVKQDHPLIAYRASLIEGILMHIGSRSIQTTLARQLEIGGEMVPRKPQAATTQTERDIEFLPLEFLELVSTFPTAHTMMKVMQQRHMIGISRTVIQSAPFLAKLLVTDDMRIGLTLQTHSLLHQCVEAFWTLLEPVSMLFFAHRDISKSTFLSSIIYSTLTSIPEYKDLFKDSKKFYAVLPSLHNLFYLLLDLSQVSPSAPGSHPRPSVPSVQPEPNVDPNEALSKISGTKLSHENPATERVNPLTSDPGHNDMEGSSGNPDSATYHGPEYEGDALM